MFSIRKCATYLVDALLLVALLISPFIWLMRDGLGPNATDSTGIAALRKAFMTFYWGPVIVVLIIFSIIGHFRCVPRGSSPSNTASKE